MFFKYKTKVFITLFGIAPLLVLCSNNIVAVPDLPINSDKRFMRIDLKQEMQTIDGFGASDAWRCQMVGKYWSEEKKNAIADLLFSRETDEKGNPCGIGLSIWRFYLGAGSMEQGSQSNISDEWRRAECFQLKDGTYDWQKQEGQRWFLQAAKKRGIDKFLAFSVSPPVYITQNGKAFSSRKRIMNIKDGMMAAYADFLVDCVEHLQQKEGIVFNYLSPMNEPQWDWLAGDNGEASQEGSPATNEELYMLTSLISERLHNRGLSTRITLGEAAAISYLYEKVNDDGRDNQVEDFWHPESSLNVKNLSNMENVITGHSYFSVWPISDQVQQRQKLNSKIKQINGLKYWQTEYCVLDNPGESEIPGGSGAYRDLGMKTALYVARIIHNDLVLSNASSWQWWTALTRADYKDGLIYLDDGTNNGSITSKYCKYDGYFRSSKLMWALGNFSFFIRPNMVRIQIENQNPDTASSDVMLSAYKDIIQQKLVIVAINTKDVEQKYQLEIDGQIKNKKLIPYITSSISNLEKGIETTIDNIVIPPQSVVTLVGELE